MRMGHFGQNVQGTPFAFWPKLLLLNTLRKNSISQLIGVCSCFLSGEVNEACLELNLRNLDGRYEDLLTMRLNFLSLFHMNITKGYHSFD